MTGKEVRHIESPPPRLFTVSDVVAAVGRQSLAGIVGEGGGYHKGKRGGERGFNLEKLGWW